MEQFVWNGALVFILLISSQFYTANCHNAANERTLPDHLAATIGAVGAGDFRRVLDDLSRLRANYTNEHSLYDIVPEDGLLKLNLHTKSGVAEFVQAVLTRVRTYSQATQAKGQAPGLVSPRCWNATQSIVRGLLSNQIWALKFIDAFGKPASSIFRDGRITWLGSYTECRETISTPVSGLIEETFHGKYCLAYIPIHSKIKIISSIWEGICIPDVCSDYDAYFLLRQGAEILATFLPQVGINASAVYPWCQPTEKRLDDKATVAVVIVSILAFLATLGTLYEVLRKFRKCPSIQDEGPRTGLLSHEVRQPPIGVLGKLLLSFSVYTNGSKLLGTHQTEGALQCVNGIRFISMTWVILGHTLAISPFTFVNIIGNMGDLGVYIKWWTFQAITNATVSVDTFFLLSGLLVGYLVLREMEKKNGCNSMVRHWVMYYVHRYIRLTPPYMLILMVYSTLLTYTNSGPIWLPADVNCPKYWWTNLLYVNNFVHSKQAEMCMGWSWYLANDMQFYIIAPIFLVPLFYDKRLGPLLVWVAALGSMVTAAVISGVNKLGPGGSAQPPIDSWDLLYIHPWTRLPPYMVGLYVGYVLYKTKCRIKIHWAVAVIGWCLAAFFCCSTLYGLYGPTANSDKWSLGVSALYNSTYRYAWSLGVAWVIFACCTGYGGFVNTLLSWKALIPLSRLTYCAYLVHPMVMMWYYYSQEVLIVFTLPNIIYYFFGHLIAAYAVAFVASLLFESPILGVEKVLLGRFR